MSVGTELESEPDVDSDDGDPSDTGDTAAEQR